MPKKNHKWWASLTQEQQEEEVEKTNIIGPFIMTASTRIDIFVIKTKREILDTTFPNPFELLGRIISPEAKENEIVDHGVPNARRVRTYEEGEEEELQEEDELGFRLKFNDFSIADYLKHSPYTVSKTPEFVLNDEKNGKRTTQGVVTEHSKPIKEKRWYFDLKSFTKVDYKDGLGYVPINPRAHTFGRGIEEEKPFSIAVFRKYVQKMEPENTELNSFLYSTLIGYLTSRPYSAKMKKLLIIEIPTLNVDSAVSSDVSRVSSDRSGYSEISTREKLLEQTIQDIPIVYVGMHGAKPIKKNKKTEKLECRKMFRNPFQNLFSFIKASPGAFNVYKRSTLNKGVFTTSFPNTLTISRATVKMKAYFPTHTVDRTDDIFTREYQINDKGERVYYPLYTESEKRNHFVVNYSNTLVCQKMFALPSDVPKIDLKNWGIFVLNEQTDPRVKLHENILRNPDFIAFIKSRLEIYSNDDDLYETVKIEEITTTKDERIEVVSKLTNKALMDYFAFLKYKQIYIIDTSCDETYHMTKEENDKFLKVAKDIEDKIHNRSRRRMFTNPNETLYRERGLVSFWEAYNNQITELKARRKDKEYYKRQGIEGLNDLIDFADNRAKTRKHGRFMSVISNNRGKFV
jgi:hypothetical protein